jgi:hypothetical protein
MKKNIWSIVSILTKDGRCSTSLTPLRAAAPSRCAALLHLDAPLLQLVRRRHYGERRETGGSW